MAKKRAAPERKPGSTSEPRHRSEVEFARILDFYGIRWEYEPRTFPLQWDEHGNVKQAFAPDFYLPDADLYIELTTMRQELVTIKNRKIRRLKELYPEVNIKILYLRDMESLMVKYGLHKRGLPWKTISEK